MSKSAPDLSPRGRIRTIAKLIQENSRTRSPWDTFSDAVELMALAISNSVDLAQFQRREERYLQIVKRYEPNEISRFTQIFAEVVSALEYEATDVLGAVFGEMEQANKHVGQFFTPSHLCRALASMMVGDGAEMRQKIDQRGFITAQEPAVGAGAMIIALAVAMQEAQLNYQEHLHVTAIDIDARAVHMAYVQFSLLNIPAVVYTGNTISLEMREAWHTPAHVLGLWSHKLRRGFSLGSGMDVSTIGDERLEHDAAQPLLPDVRMGQLDLFEVAA